MTLSIRTLTTPAEIRAAERLAYELCVRERDTLTAIADHDRELVMTDGGSEATILGAFEGDELVGALSLLFWADRPFPACYDELLMLDRFAGVTPRDTWMMFTGMAIRPTARARLVTMQLLSEAYALSQARGVELMFTSCRPNQLDRYRKLGLRTFAPAFDDGASVRIPLVAFSGDHDHLRALGSPMLLLVDPRREHPELAARGRAALAGSLAPLVTRRSDPKAFAAALRSLLDDPSPVSAFAGFSFQQLEALLGCGEILTCREGLKLISARQDARTVYVVLDGVLVGSRDGYGFRIERGELIGEIALLTGCRRTADVYVRSETARVLCLSEAIMRELMDARSLSATRFLRNLSRILAARLAS